MKKTVSIRISLLIAGLMLCAGATRLFAQAQTVEFIIEPPIVQLGQAASAEFRIRGVRQAIAPQIPRVDGLEFSYRGQTMKMTTVNGRRDQFIAHQYSIIPLKAGEYTIGPFRYKIGNSVYGVPEQHLKVVSQGGSEIDWASMLFMDMDASTNDLYVGQTINVDFSLYSRTGLQLDGRITPQQLPTAGVTIKEMNELSGRREKMGDEDFEVRRFRIAFQVLTAGEFTFEPEFKINVLMKTQQRSRRRSFWDDPFGSMNNYQRIPMTLSPEPMQLTVLHPPVQNRPAGYEGAVGNFQMHVTLKPRSLQVGEPVTLQTVISGQGNVESLTAPTFEPGDGFRIYESKMISSDLNRAGTSGRKIFEQVIIPRTVKDNRVPPLTFSYFDPQRKDYVTLQEGPFELDLTASPSTEKAVVVGSTDQPASSPVEILNEDIAYVKPEPTEWLDVSRGPLGRAPGWPIWIHITGASLVLAGAGIVKTRNAKPTDVARQRRTSAPSKARKGLEKANAQIQSGDMAEALETLYQTISDFSSDLYNWSPGEFDPATLSKTLAREGLEHETISRLMAILHSAETLRYGGNDSAGLSTRLSVEDVEQVGLTLTEMERVS